VNFDYDKAKGIAGTLRKGVQQIREIIEKLADRELLPSIETTITVVSTDTRANSLNKKAKMRGGFCERFP